MIQKQSPDVASLFEADETAWLESMAELICQQRYDELDYPNLSEYLLDMARRDRREVKSRLTVLMAHLLKWSHQPEKRSGSWRSTIIAQRQRLRDLCSQGVLRSHAQDVLAEAYGDAVERAAAETGLSQDALPAKCPYSLPQLFSSDVLAD